MKRMVLGALVGAGLLVVAVGAVGHRGAVSAERLAPPYQVGAGDSLIAVPAPVSEKGQMLTVVDPKLRVMSVYHIDLTTGKISLKSVRNINWDLQMMYLNNDNPLPQEIRSLLEQK